MTAYLESTLGTVAGLVAALAVLTSAGLATVAAVRGPRSRLVWAFGLGMVGFAVEAGTALGLFGTESPEDRLRWLRLLTVAGLWLPVPWLQFVGALATPSGASVPRGWRVGALAAGAGALVGSVALVTLPGFLISDLPGPFYAARLDTVGRLATIGQLIGTVGVLAGLERGLRSSRWTDRWRVKFLVLGLGGVFLVRFYLLSHLLLFEVVLASYLATAAATLTLGNLAVAGALARGALLGLDLVLSRQLVMRSAVVAVLGCYLFVVGGLGWLLTRLGVAEELFWGSLVVFVSALGLATILLSESARWRLKRFLGRHVYRSRYDYREQWVGFTRRMGSLLSVEELAPQLVGAVTDAVGSARGALYLADEGDGAWRLAGARGVDGLPAMVPAAGGLAARVQDAGEPVLVENGPAAGLLPAGLAEVFAGGLVAVPLRWRGQTTGALLVGAERTGARYTPEDLEFLATVGEQAAGVLVTARLSETLARAREFEAFHRLTSFVLHDLKNAIAALSMLGQNAAANFDDPEFQRDALRTLTRTVERMKRLMGRLSTAPDSAALRFQPVDVAELLREATLPVAADPRVRLVSEVVPVPPVAGDPDALLRVFQNLVANAGQALDGAGSIIVRTAVEGDRVVCTVSDTGCGIPEEFLRKSLFAPFRSTKKGGWGIGLYQVKGIVEGHGGSIEVASRVGEGTTVWVRLPRDGRGEPGSGR